MLAQTAFASCDGEMVIQWLRKMRGVLDAAHKLYWTYTPKLRFTGKTLIFEGNYYYEKRPPDGPTGFSFTIVEGPRKSFRLPDRITTPEDALKWLEAMEAMEKVVHNHLVRLRDTAYTTEERKNLGY